MPSTAPTLGASKNVDLDAEVFEQPVLSPRDQRTLVDVLTRLRHSAGDF